LAVDPEPLTPAPDPRPLTPDPRGNFPLLVSIGAKDPLVKGLTKGVAAGSGRLRVEALAMLVLMGYAEDAALGLVEATADAAERDALLRELLTFDVHVSRCRGLFGMLGHLLRPQYASSTETIMSHLSVAWAGLPASGRWQLLAAVKSGVDFEALSRLTFDLPPPTSGAPMRWLQEMGHMTPQDRQRLGVCQDAAERLRRMERIDLRRGYLVDGRYGALAIVETVVAQGPWHSVRGIESSAQLRYRWSAPQRVTIVLPTLQLRSTDKDESFEVVWGKQVLGRGMVKDQERIRPPSTFSPRLEEADQAFLGITGWGWPDPQNPARRGEVAVGPALLANRVVSHSLSPGKMTIDVCPLLRAALQQRQDVSNDDLVSWMPEACRITLRYAAFGSFYGAGPRRPFPVVVVPVGHRHLLNVMLVLERMD
jgi:hypothetical protein